MTDTTARAELRRVVHMMADSWTPEATTDERTDRLYNAIRAEVLRERRRAILAASLEGPTDPNASETWTRGYRAGLSVAADLTTPAARPEGSST